MCATANKNVLWKRWFKLPCLYGAVLGIKIQDQSINKISNKSLNAPHGAHAAPKVPEIDRERNPGRVSKHKHTVCSYHATLFIDIEAKKKKNFQLPPAVIWDHRCEHKSHSYSVYSTKLGAQPG